MEFFTKLLESMDGNIIEYCILGGIVVLVIILIVSIISCIKSLGDKDSKRKYAKINVDDYVDEVDEKEEDPVKELINVAISEKEEDNIADVELDKEELKIAEKIEIPESVEYIDNTVLKEEKNVSRVVQKLDIKSITREMELRLEEDSTDINAYEDEQEKTAIISYKELLEAASRIEANAGNEEEYIDDVVFEFNSKRIVDDEQPKHAMKKFRPTIDISPVFGARKVEMFSDQDDLLKIEEVTDEEQTIEQRENFLKNLQDFRNNLD